MTGQAAADARQVDEQQQEVVDFLSSPQAHNGALVKRIDTHLSHVFLAGDRAYKVKRALRYDFVDFSSIEQRRRACENEVRLNRRTAPGMYLGVVPLYRGSGGAAWRGDGEPVEWAVEMRRFDENEQFDRLAARGALDEAMIAALAERLAHFHLDAARIEGADGHAAVCDVIDQVAFDLDAQARDEDWREKSAQWKRFALAALEDRRALLQSRARHGCMRRCHGDLHLANICLFDGEPAPFDAIEFSEDLANVDILYDLAFTLMDLVHHARPDLANLLVSRYLSLTRDYAGCGLLPLFQSMRAAIRAMVLALPGQPPGSQRDAERYLALAIEFLDYEIAPRLLAVGGYSGTGKSTLASALALEILKPAGAVLLQSDVIRKRLCQAPLESRLDQSAYAPTRSEEVYRRLLRDARRALRAGTPVVLDATFLDPATRRSTTGLACTLNLPFIGFWLTGPRDVLTARLRARAGGVSDATVDVLAKQLEHPHPPTDWNIIDAGRTPPQMLEQARQILFAKD